VDRNDTTESVAGQSNQHVKPRRCPPTWCFGYDAADGTILEVRAGEGAAIPKGWKGHWSTAGYKKYYVTYESGPPK
jgi:hypothetical protein